MPVEITRLRPDSPSPTAKGSVIVREHPPGRREVRFVAGDGPRIIYSSDLTIGDDLERVVEWAVGWAGRRSLDRIYVETAPDPADGPAGQCAQNGGAG